MNYISDENTIEAINQKNNEKKEIHDQNNNCNGRNGSFRLIDNILYVDTRESKQGKIVCIYI